MKKKIRIEGTVETVPEKKSGSIDLETIMCRSLDSVKAENELKFEALDDDDIDPKEFIRILYEGRT